jgi:nitrite reductase (NADH) large subunit
MTPSLIFAGNGMSAAACVEDLFKTGQVFDITIFGDEPYANYDRALLPSVLAGDRDFDSIVLNDIEWYQEHGIRTRLGIRIEEIDRMGRAVRSSDGDWTSYDKLILATGSSPIIPPASGLEKEGVFVFGTLDETRRIIDAASKGPRAVVIGGWQAAEIGRGLQKRGCDVTVVDTESGASGRTIEAVLGDGRAEAVRFTDGEEVQAGLVVIAMGFRPNIQLAVDAGLEAKRGILVNDRLETSDSHIFALGGCTEDNEQTNDCLPPFLEQAKVLAATLVGLREQDFTDLDAILQDLAASPLHHRAK